ncbi:MAG: M1 family aminopeptidase [Pseudomonadota bacterium]
MIKLDDYKAYPFLIEKTDLFFKLDPENTLVRAKLRVKRVEQHICNMWLDGEDLELKTIAINGKTLNKDAYQLNKNGLRLINVPANFELEIETLIHPIHNTRLEGLYFTENIFCTQCEANSFRRITFYPDRPDCLSLWSVTIEADKKHASTLLSNGNPIHSERDQHDQDGSIINAHWDDPFYKPAYLFALVAGHFSCLNDHFKTNDGRDIKLGIYCEVEKTNLARFAMSALKEAMQWDQERFNLTCDLDVYNIVAIHNFNMGAMENKGLNVFNAKYVLIDHKTATDQELSDVRSVIGHEYFHNWSLHIDS